ncbi:hypothetical protein KM176_11550 [Pseudooceanicola sp. CBS1P-1]|uniref:Uncharacterized protein n=1 Tax=Pseudooceanicola albus TaxID=2692189 RepID=A0A6L7G958_9RHOB|nr:MULTISPECIES: hypothetical protein [Pseudooceanicola]MBT9384495.1 hypothetical protein [Pseudooceanicola endophyticus]MXN20605.1 hypothetical protein [Pseudooceanicola albus]
MPLPETTDCHALIRSPEIALSHPEIARAAWSRAKAARGEAISPECLSRLAPAYLRTTPSTPPTVAEQIQPHAQRALLRVREIMARRGLSGAPKCC